ncbi:hypothetical protein [Gardnerella vaginalis]|uniref:DUF4235 domain-containing protein n=1 Tax=Gardnerella vaginalis TaxID=2702 RepID=A0AAW6Y2C0_GARVA|nr:hypothetical protein [Gardnerella vaginalis]MDK7063928.1 hypothetical protein [Gardnerella vaginalis]
MTLTQNDSRYDSRYDSQHDSRQDSSDQFYTESYNAHADYSATHNTSRSATRSASNLTIKRLNRVSDKAIALKQKRLKNPDTLLDMIAKSAIPAIVTMVVGKVAEIVWKHYVKNNKMHKIAQNKQFEKYNKNKSSKNKDVNREDYKEISKDNKQEDSLLMSIGLAIFSTILTTVAGRYTNRAVLSAIKKRQSRRK